MQLDFLHFVVLIAGLAAGGVAAWAVFKGRLALAEATGRGAGDVERATLTEQLKAALQGVAQERQRGLLAEDMVNRFRACLETAKSERAQFAERTARIPELEGSLGKSLADVQAKTQEIAELREHIGGLTTDVEARR